MKIRKISIWVGLALMLFAGTVSAQNQDEKAGVDCFDYYHFQSVQVSLGTDKDSYIPQEYVVFSGDVINENDYPVVDGNIFMRIGRRNRGYMQDGNFIVDELIAMNGISLDAKGKRPVNIRWQVPEEMVGGEYQADFFFSVGKKFNLGGLPFTNEIFVGRANFSVGSAADGTIEFDRSSTTVDGDKYEHIGLWPIIEPNSKAEISQKLVNTTGSERAVQVTYDLFYWDSLDNKDKITTKKEEVNIGAGDSTELKYQVGNMADPIYYVRITAVSGSAKSIVNVRLSSNQSRPRLNYPAIDGFPFKAGDKANLFTCFHNTSALDTNGSVEVELHDKAGQQVGQLRYQGKITGEMMADKADFSAATEYDWLKLTATVKNDKGVVVDRYETVYDCNNLESAKCQEVKSILAAREAKKAATQRMVIIVFFILLISIVAFFLSRHYKGKNGFSGGGILKVVIFGVAFWAMGDPLFVAMAANEQSRTVSENFAFKTSGGQPGIDLSGTCYVYQRPGVWNPASLTFSATAAEFYAAGTTSLTHVVGMTSGGTNVSSGDAINFHYSPEQPVYTQTTGMGFDTPLGDWCSDITTRSCARNSAELLRACTARNGCTGTFPNERWINVVAVRPTVSIASSNPSVVSCSGLNCTAQNVSTPTTVTLTASIPQTTAAVFVEAANNPPGYPYQYGDHRCHQFIPFYTSRHNYYPAPSAITWSVTVNPRGFTLTVTKSGAGSGTITSSPSGINCGSDCNETYAQNTVVTLTAIASSGSTFSGWSSNCSRISANQCQTTIDAAKTVNASFDLSPVPLANCGRCSTWRQYAWTTFQSTDLTCVSVQPPGNPVRLSCNCSCPGNLTSNPPDTTWSDPVTGDSWASCAPTCASPPPRPVCGNGIVEGGEQCDMGSRNGACPSTCSSSCSLQNCPAPVTNCSRCSTWRQYARASFQSTDATCATVQPASNPVFLSCDCSCPGNLTSYPPDTTWTDTNTGASWATCAPTCGGPPPPPSCGNGIFEPGLGEQCDNGFFNGGCPSLCTATCQNQTCPVCGNGVLEGTEQCDAGAANGACPSTCSAACTNQACATCGNGVVEGTEQCDFGVNNGACPNLCTATCQDQTCCTPDPSCQTTTCVGNTCRDVCGNTYNGLKQCASPGDYEEVR